jgi:hypothetical protein
MMRHSKTVRVVSLERAARVAAAALLAAVAIAAAASPALAGTTHRGSSHAATALPTTGLVSIRHVILQTAMGGAAIMLLLTIGLLFLGRASKAAAGPMPLVTPQAGPEKDTRSSGATSESSWLGEAIELDEHPSAPPDAPPPDVPATGSGLAAPSWLGLADPPADVDSASQVSQPTAADPASSSDDEHSWSDFLALDGDSDPAGIEPPDSPRSAEPHSYGELAEPVLPPAALRILGAGPPRPGDDDLPTQRHQVVLGDDRIEVVLAELEPEHEQGGGRLAAPRYVRWAPLPYDVPDDGLAFACIGAGDEGCLFVDLAAAPGGVAITGDPDAAVRLAESIVHQLCASAAADQAISVLLVGGSIPEPHPAGATSVETLSDLATAGLDSRPGSTDIVFCELRSNEDAFALVRHVSSSRHRMVPVVIGQLPGAAWSFTASPEPVL